MPWVGLSHFPVRGSAVELVRQGASLLNAGARSKRGAHAAACQLDATEFTRASRGDCDPIAWSRCACRGGTVRTARSSGRASAKAAGDERRTRTVVRDVAIELFLH